MLKLCRFLLWAFAIVYAMALLVFATAYFGLFGAEPTPMAGIFLIPLGLPWVLLGDPLAGLLGNWFLPFIGYTAPLINLLLLLCLCRFVERKAQA